MSEPVGSVPPSHFGRGGTLLGKFRGCYRTFGLAETIRRSFRELRRMAFPRDPAILDVAEVTPTLLVGAAPRSEVAVRRLVEIGVTDVLDLRGDRKLLDPLTRASVLRIHWVPTEDDWRPKGAEFFEAVERVGKEVWARRNARLLVCCRAGEHRAPLGCAVVLADLVGDLDRACALIKSARPVAEFLPVYTASLAEYRRGRIAR